LSLQTSLTSVFYARFRKFVSSCLCGVLAKAGEMYRFRQFSSVLLVRFCQLLVVKTECRGGGAVKKYKVHGAALVKFEGPHNTFTTNFEGFWRWKICCFLPAKTGQSTKCVRISKGQTPHQNCGYGRTHGATPLPSSQWDIWDFNFEKPLTFVTFRTFRTFWHQIKTITRFVAQIHWKIRLSSDDSFFQEMNQNFERVPLESTRSVSSFEWSRSGAVFRSWLSTTLPPKADYQLVQRRID